jgi:hypothetical protein
MARVTKVSISPTKPLSNITAKLAFELSKVLLMFVTILNKDITTTRTN